MRQLKIVKQITARESYSLDKYLQEIGHIQVLSSDEEVELARRSRDGDEEAKEKLVLCNLRFVVSVAKQYQKFGLSLADLICEGNLGLIKAVECFDETKGFKFISYAVWWIRQSILQAISENARLIRLPQNKLNLVTKVNRQSTILEQHLQRDPTDEEVASHLDMQPQQIQEHFRIASLPVSIDAPLTNDDNASTLCDIYIATNPVIETTENILNQESLRKDIARSFLVLTEKEISIVQRYYGLDGFSPMSLEEIGTELKMSSERVRQIKSKAIKKLKEIKNNKWLKSYL